MNRWHNCQKAAVIPVRTDLSDRIETDRIETDRIETDRIETDRIETDRIEIETMTPKHFIMHRKSKVERNLNPNHDSSETPVIGTILQWNAVLLVPFIGLGTAQLVQAIPSVDKPFTQSFDSSRAVQSHPPRSIVPSPNSVQPIAAPPPKSFLQAALTPSPEAFNLQNLREGICSPSVKGITESSISELELTTPSFWWVRDEIAAQAQFGRRLIDRWIACPEDTIATHRVDFLVNQQVWSLLDYLERYQLVQRLGTVASSYQHNVRVFNRQGTLLAAYTCAFSAAAATSSASLKQAQKMSSAQLQQLPCRLSLDTGGKSGYWGRSTNPLDGAFPNSGGTGRL